MGNMTIQPVFSGAPNSIQGGVLAPPGYQGPQGLANYQPGYYSKLAYQMAGSPNQGPFPSSAGPPLIPYSTGGYSGGGGSAVSSAVGVLNDLNRARNLYNQVSGLLNPGVSQGQLASLYNQGLPASVTDVPSVAPPVTDATNGGPLYSGASNANADLAAQEADQYTANGGLLGSSSAADAGAGSAG